MNAPNGAGTSRRPRRRPGTEATDPTPAAVPRSSRSRGTRFRLPWARDAIGLFALLAFLSTIPLANWLVQTYGAVSIGFGLMAPAGVFVAGLAFTLRDIAHRLVGLLAVVAAIAVGTALSALVADGRLVLASAVAFAVSELLDLAVYTPLRKRGWARAVIASNAVGLVVDSVLFLWIAFGSFDFLAGQVVAKAAVTLLAVGVLALVHRRVVIA
jgi:queuosine precursor transporter